MQRLMLAAVLALLSAPASAQDVSGIVPASSRAGFGYWNNNVPFSWEPNRFQQVFLGSELPKARVMFDGRSPKNSVASDSGRARGSKID